MSNSTRTLQSTRLEPRGIIDAAELVVREGTAHVDEDDLTSRLHDLEGKQGEEWRQAREAILGALGAVRKQQEREDRS